MASQPDTEPAIFVRQHPDLFYWWPLWCLPFMMALYGYMQGERLGVLPPGTQVTLSAEGDKLEAVAPADQQPPVKLQVVTSPRYELNLVFLVVLVVLVLVNSVKLGHLASIVLMSLLGLLVAGVLLTTTIWPNLLDGLPSLGPWSVHISTTSYLILGTTLLLFWLPCMLIPSPNSLIFTPTRVIIQQEFGEVVTPFAPGGIHVEVQEGTMRDWLLGMGSGTLKVTLRGPKPRTFEFRGVLFFREKLARIQQVVEMGTASTVS